MWYGSQGLVEPSIICIFDITKGQGLPPTTIHEVTKKAQQKKQKKTPSQIQTT